MIDIDLTDIKMLPANHIALKDYDYVNGVANKNKMLKEVLILLSVSVIVVIVTYKIYENGKRKKD